MRTSFPREWEEARNSRPVSDEWLEGLLSHRDEGPIGEPAARDLLREVLRLRQIAVCDAVVLSPSEPVILDFENPLPAPKTGIATLHTFRTTGKWYATGRAKVVKTIFEGMNSPAKRQQILRDNGNACPGLSSRGEHFVWVVLLDDDVDFGFPLMLRPEGG